MATYRTYDEALILKKKIQAVKVPVTVYRGAVDKKLYFAVKAGPYTSKKQAEETASRLKSEVHLAQAPKLVKMEAESGNNNKSNHTKVPRLTARPRLTRNPNLKANPSRQQYQD